MDQRTAEAGDPRDTRGAGDPTTEFDDADDLLRRLFDLCSPEQQRRGRTPREALARLSPDERARLLQQLGPAAREEVRKQIGR